MIPISNKTQSEIIDQKIKQIKENKRMPVSDEEFELALSIVKTYCNKKEDCRDCSQFNGCGQCSLTLTAPCSWNRIDAIKSTK